MKDDISPYEWCALMYAKFGMPIEEARDTVLLRCLEQGDAAAFSYIVLAGHQPGAKVIRTLAVMTAETVTDRVAEMVPFTLQASPRRPGKKGRRSDPLLAMRDEAIALNVKARINGPGMYDAAISEVHALLDGALDKRTIRNAYDQYFAKGKK